MDITTLQAKTKSGKSITVAIIPVALMTSDRPEARNDQASALAIAAGCGPRAWRLVDAAGAIVQLPSRTYAQAAAMSGPANERHDW